MDCKTLAVVFGTVCPAEPGDKTQPATVLSASDKAVGKWLVFVGHVPPEWAVTLVRNTQPGLDPRTSPCKGRHRRVG